MPSVKRTIVSWTVRLVLGLLALGLLYVAILAFPAPLFAYQKSYGTYRVHSDEVLADDFDRVIDELDRRIRGMEHPPPEASQRIYLCGSGKYALFAFLLRKDPQSLAIGLSVFNETFVSLDRVRLFAANNRGVFRHSRFEGNLAEVVAHEIAHFNSVRALGYRVHLSQPMWKSEGWAEYQANRAAIRADPDYDLGRRVERLLDGRYWGDRLGVARSLWESQLLVEFLGEVEGLGLDELIRHEVTESSARERMMAWYRKQAAARVRPSGAGRTLIAASNMLHPPFSSWGAAGKPVGIEVDIVEAAARELGCRVEWVERPFSELLAALERGEIDIAVSTIGITDERKQRVAFSEPYYRTQIVALVGRDETAPRSLDALAESRIGADEATTAHPAARARWPSATLIGKARDGMTWPEMVERGLIDAFVVDASDQQRLESVSGVSLFRIDEPLAAEYFGVAVALGDDELRTALNRAIESASRLAPR